MGLAPDAKSNNKQSRRLSGWRLKRAQSLLRSADLPRFSFYRKLATLLGRGASMRETLENILESLDGSSSPVVPALKVWLPAVKAGRTIHEISSGWLPQAEIRLIQAGEKTGSLTSQLRRIVVMGDQKNRITSAIKSASWYPLIVSVVLIAVLEIYGYFVIPELMASIDKLAIRPEPGPAGSLLIWLSSMVRSYGLLLPGLAATVYLGSRWLLPRWTGRLRIRFETIWPFSFYRMTEGSNVLIGLAALIGSGMSPADAVAMQATKSSPYTRSRLAPVEFWCRKGLFLGESLARTGLGFPDWEIIRDLKIYAKEAALAEALEQLANDWIEEAVKRLTVKAEHFKVYATLFLLGFVAIMAFGVIDIIYAITTSTNSLYKY